MHTFNLVELSVVVFVKRGEEHGGVYGEVKMVDYSASYRQRRARFYICSE